MWDHPPPPPLLLMLPHRSRPTLCRRRSAPCGLGPYSCAAAVRLRAHVFVCRTSIGHVPLQSDCARHSATNRHGPAAHLLAAISLGKIAEIGACHDTGQRATCVAFAASLVATWHDSWHGASQNDDRRAAYSCDVTYVTNSELGFDYLRDNLATVGARLLQGLSAEGVSARGAQESFPAM